MEVELSIIILCTLAYVLAGFVDAVAGGGGLITIPSLMLFNIPPHIVLGTNKFASSIGSFTAIWPFLRNKLIVLHLVPCGFASAFLGGIIGSWLALQLDSVLLGKIMAFLLPLGLVCTFFAGRNMREDQQHSLTRQKVYVSIIGIVIGIYDGFFGPGTGSFFILALHMVLGMGLVKASGTTKVLNLASNVGALAAFASGGVVLYALAIPCAFGSIVGNQLGARMAITVGVKAVRLFLYLALFLLFSTLIYKYFIAS